jgi:hypothetical protein
MPINEKYSYNGVTPAVLAEISRLQAECEMTVRARVALYRAIPNPRPADEALMVADVTAIRNACNLDTLGGEAGTSPLIAKFIGTTQIGH